MFDELFKSKKTYERSSVAANCQKLKGGEGRFFTHQPTVLCPKIGKGFLAYHWGERHHHCYVNFPTDIAKT